MGRMWASQAQELSPQLPPPEPCSHGADGGDQKPGTSAALPAPVQLPQ